MKKRLVRKRKPSLHAAAFTTEIIWSFQERSEPKVRPNIDILSRNSNELELKEMSGRFLSMLDAANKHKHAYIYILFICLTHIYI